VLESLGNIGDFLGGIGVVVTLAYLAVQIRQKTRVTRTSNFQDLSIAYNNFSAKIADSDDLADIFARGLVSFESLADNEKVRFSMLLSEALTLAQLGFQQNARGLLDDALSKNFLKSTGQFFRAPGVAERGNSVRDWYHPDFRDYVDRVYLSGLGAEPPDV
jgi:hypothetical protein